MPSGLGEGRLSHPKAAAAALTTAMERARLNPLSSAVLAVESPAELNRVGFRRGRQFVEERFGGEGDLWPIGIPQISRARSGVSKTRGRPTTWVAMSRCGMTYISDGVAAPPAAGLDTPCSGELSDQHGIGLVVTEVMVVGGSSTVLPVRRLTTK